MGSRACREAHDSERAAGSGCRCVRHWDDHMTVNVPLAVVAVVFAIGMVVIILVLLRRITFKSKTAVTASDFKS